ncbi:probable ureidoglycolate hydrolase [Selaginella moellendorffii]|uniref:probable ureidoglycolate hydrolase n=1 Tax=Selaginella moellendorffii TaxID=88036 RepID=UPI000D1C2407|nr:probable ureidoglycolate hydrolase [Selaginella moellendorffii]|eukprot:XP_002981561.2 probable ureidoglycolate hydrolase [Selaginella moellendorffii]
MAAMALLCALLHSLFLLLLAFDAQEDPVGLTSSCPTARFGSLCTSFDPANLEVNPDDIQDAIDKLATFSDTPAPSVTRILYTDNDVAARSFIRELMESAQLTVREDAIGNIFGRWQGSEPSQAVVASGSHTDAIPYAGKYDGVVGVVGAVEAIKALRRAGFQPKRSLEAIMFTSEEPTRFGLSCIGSRVLAGDPRVAVSLANAVDEDNITFTLAANRAGYDEAGDNLQSVAVGNETYAAFVELHIEQGPLLEEQGVSIGIVTAIAGPASLGVEFAGGGGHAGAVLMHLRNDAGLAAAELALAVERHVLESGSQDTVGTTGMVKLYPGAINSIPRNAQLGIDIRDIDGSRRDAVVERVRATAHEIAARRGVVLQNFTVVNQDPPAQSTDFVIEAVKEASEELGLGHKMMISRAYHDSLFMARIAPTAMIFIPCYRGYSHRPDEHATLEDMANGVRVLALALSKLSSN